VADEAINWSAGGSDCEIAKIFGDLVDFFTYSNKVYANSDPLNHRSRSNCTSSEVPEANATSRMHYEKNRVRQGVQCFRMACNGLRPSEGSARHSRSGNSDGLGSFIPVPSASKAWFTSRMTSEI